MAELFGAIGTSLALLEQLLKLTRETKTLISDMRLFGSDSEKLRLRFSIEERRLASLHAILFTPTTSFPTYSRSVSAADGGERCLAQLLPKEVMVDVYAMLAQLEGILAQGRTLRIAYGLGGGQVGVGGGLGVGLGGSTSIVTTNDPTSSKTPQTSSLLNPPTPAPTFLKKAKWALSAKPKAESIVTEFAAWNSRVRMVLEDVLWPHPTFRSLAGVQMLQGVVGAKGLGIEQRAKLRRLVIRPKGGGWEEGELRIERGRFLVGDGEGGGSGGGREGREGREGRGRVSSSAVGKFIFGRITSLEGSVSKNPDPEVELPDISELNLVSSPTTTCRPVITELKTLDPDDTLPPGSETYPSPTTSTTPIHHLAALLSRHNDPNFHVLHCRGYIDNFSPSSHTPYSPPLSTTIALVYDIPAKYHSSTSSSITAITLLDAIPLVKSPTTTTTTSSSPSNTPRSSSPSPTPHPSSSPYPNFRPPLGSRFTLAHKLASTLHLLHTVGWVHKSLRSENVLFFTPSPSPQPQSTDPQPHPHPPIDIHSPHLFGFTYSRRTSDFSSRRNDDSLKRNIYRHPRRWGVPRERFGKVHDIYALGVILLEIGLWQRAETLDPTSFKSLSHSPEKVQERYLRHAEKRLGYTAGERYQAVVRKCISGELAVVEEKSEEEEGGDEDEMDGGGGMMGDKAAEAEFRIHKRFRTEVVEVLERLAREV